MEQHCIARDSRETQHRGGIFGIPVSSPWGAVTSGSAVEGGELAKLAVDMAADSSFGPASLPIVLECDLYTDWLRQERAGAKQTG